MDSQTNNGGGTGKLCLVGLGPGDTDHLTPLALAALDQAEWVVGYRAYVEQVSPLVKEKNLLAMNLGQEMERAAKAVDLAYGYRTDNPAGEAIEAALPRLAKVRAHRKALPYAEVPGFLAELRQTRRAYPQPDQAGLLALRFLVLTAARSAEVRAARWDEMNMKDGLWTVPAYRMKARKQHRVPLSTQAMDTLIEARDQLGVWGDGLIFPGRGGNQLGMNIFEQRLKANGVACVPHGFRSSFRDWAAEQTNYTREAIELSLAHNVGNETERAYFRSDLLDQRRGLMQDWADFAALSEEA